MNIVIKFLSDILNQLYYVVNDWGITIILITLLIKILLIPLTIKQKKGLELQQKLSKEVESIKKKYSNDKVKMEKEISKISSKYSGSMIGCLLTFVQLPIMISLYRAIASIPLEVTSTVILPWITNLKAPDNYYIIPIISVIIHLMPNIMYYLNIFKELELTKPNKVMIISTIIINALFISKAPVIIGLYWIVSGLYTFIEQLITNIIMLRKKAQYKASLQEE
ncbi:membrane protein insertase YidC [Vallitalea guaymasensis]|uniref:Membrane protein insertase YidC n=1 Tax=Vallitalea guaymasensis TaxID=1185412 RepID=A0A8J8MDV6_9FIRM|nr:membrane protein insertase YidC [Vallitalea guaymasensis]QUH31244.1 membrane protein insertase YidC [Vallitalea guaymasensis]